MMRFIQAAILVFSMAIPATATTIDFEEFSELATIGPGDFPEAVFSASPGPLEVGSYGVPTWGTAAPKIACPRGGIESEDYCSGTLSVAFTSPVRNLTFYYTGDAYDGIVAVAEIFDGGFLLSSLDLPGDGQYWTAHLVDFSAFTGVTQLTVTVTGASRYGGLGYDDFSFEAETPVPEPGTLLMVGGGLLALARLRRRR